jgi:hypothetical protein
MGLAFEAAPAAPESLVDLPRPGLPQTQLFALLSYREACRLGCEGIVSKPLLGFSPSPNALSGRSGKASQVAGSETRG